MYQTMSYEAQMEMKAEQVKNILNEAVNGEYLFEGVKDKSVESQRIVETLERIGYTEDEIEAFIKNWGDKSDKQTAKGIL